ncbi:MAG: phosphate ABC transporter permease subunit PstC [Acidobacteria bacterium]|nr:phosphate ABC transporter permease subunit PstC [Acidobacteriota bacterium]
MASQAPTLQDTRATRVSGLRSFFNMDGVAQALVWVAGWAIVAITAVLVFELWMNSAETRQKFGFDFLFSTTWDPVNGDFGALPFIFGTLATSAVALIIAVPLGIGASIFLAELAPPRISDALTFCIELLAAVPSVIFGLIGIFVLVPALQVMVPWLKAGLGFLPIFSGAFYGVSILSAGVVLAVMIVPFIISISREVLMAVPRDLREAALALGATQWESTWQVVLPFAKVGVIGSVFLALARALGETMAVTMVVGNTPKIQASLLAPGYSIAAVIANEFPEAGGIQMSALIELGLVLFTLTIIINGAARLLILATETKGAK